MMHELKKIRAGVRPGGAPRLPAGGSLLTLSSSGTHVPPIKICKARKLQLRKENKRERKEMENIV